MLISLLQAFEFVGRIALWLWPMASATPDMRFLSKPQKVAPFVRHQIILLVDKYVNNCPESSRDSVTTGNWTRDLLIASSMFQSRLVHYTTTRRRRTIYVTVKRYCIAYVGLPRSHNGRRRMYNSEGFQKSNRRRDTLSWDPSDTASFCSYKRCQPPHTVHQLRASFQQYDNFFVPSSLISVV